MESSKATAKCINQVASEPQATQILLMQHQCTELPPSNFQRKQKKSFKSRQATNKYYQEDKQREKCHKCIKDLIILTKLMQVRKNIPVKTDVINVVTPHMWRNLDVQPLDINARIGINLVILVACATRKKSLKMRESQENAEHMVGRASTQDSLCGLSD